MEKSDFSPPKLWKGMRHFYSLTFEAANGFFFFFKLCQVFSKNIFAILQGLKAREDGKLRGHSSMAPGVGRTVVPQGGPPPGMGPPVQQQGPVYSRYDQERFRGKEGKHTNQLMEQLK